MCNNMNINKNPVRDYRSVESRCHKTSRIVRYATSMLQYGCIPYGMQGVWQRNITFIFIEKFYIFAHEF